MTAIRKLRDAMGLSQSAFSQLVGCSYSSIQNYERGIPVPEEMVEKIVSLAAQRGFADIGAELRGKFEVKRALAPGETFISSKRRRGEDSTSPAPAVRSSLGAAERDRFHAMLDEVLNSGDPDAIPAVLSNLDVFTKYVRVRAKAASARKKGA